MKKLLLFLEMIFVYPAIFLSSLRVLKSDFELKYDMFKLWTKYYLKILNVRIELIHANLIPLENGFLFIASHESAIDTLVLVEALPVTANFVLDMRESIPYMNVWMKRIHSLWFDRSNQNYTVMIEPFNQTFRESENLCVFMNALNGSVLTSAFLDLAYQSQKTLIPVKISGTRTALTKIGLHKVKVEIGLPIHYEEYGSSSKETCLQELDLRIGAL